MMKTKRKSHPHTMSSAPARAKKISVDLPDELRRESEEIIAELHTTTSAFVREALEKHIAQIRRSRLEEELALGYAANAEAIQKIHDEFRYVDSELV